MGIATTPIATAIAQLEWLLSPELSQAAPLTIDWQRFKGVYEARRRRPLLERLGTDVADPAKPLPQNAMSATLQAALLQELQAAPISERRGLLATCLQRLVGEVLGFEAGRLPEMQKGFFDMGMDSLTAMEFRNRLESSLGSALPSTLAFDYNNVAVLTDFLYATLFAAENAEKETTPAPAPSNYSQPSLTVDELSEMSDEEVEVLLLKKLAMG